MEFKIKKSITKENEIPGKLARFDKFCAEMKGIVLQGSDKYAGSEKDKKETVDVMVDILGKQGLKMFVLGDMIKRIFRYKNQERERDLFKLAVWAFLLWDRLHPEIKEDKKWKIIAP